MYITYSEYTELYAPVDEKVFNRLALRASRHIDRLTTGVDGVKKLRVAFPVDEDSVSAVKHCAAEAVNILWQIQEAEKSASLGRGYTETENGLQGKVISSVSAGNESISFSTGGTQKTVIDYAVSDPSIGDRLICKTIRKYLSGVQDANGVNLLYMGVYPCV
jgi:hypothetical protein